MLSKMPVGRRGKCIAMTQYPAEEGETARAPYPPAFNLPPVITWLIAALCAIHLVRWTGLVDDFLVLGLFGFIPARFSLEPIFPTNPFLETASRIWSFLTYALLHASWMHLAVNCTWMLAFGSFVARRLGPLRFLLLSAIGAVAGSLFYLLAHRSEIGVLIGASAAISAQVAAAARLMFVRPFSLRSALPGGVHDVVPLSLVETFTNRRALTFILVWLGLNLLFGLTGVGTGDEGQIAWESHLGGFAAGLLLLGILDRQPKR